jgi:predicted nucleotidyltransferase
MKTMAEWHTCTAEEQALLWHCKTVVHQLVPEATLMLYGSRARGEATSVSDFDLLILVDGEVLPELGEQLDNALYDIELEYGVVISAIVFNRQHWNHPRYKAMPLHQHIDHDGVLL